MSSAIQHRLAPPGLLLVILLASRVWVEASGLQLISMRDSVLGAPAGGGGDSYLSSLSPDGRYVLFSSTANNLCSLGSNQPISGPVPAPLNVFLRDLSNRTTVLVSANVAGTGGADVDAYPISVSTNGRFVLFESSATNLSKDDTNGVSNIFLRDVAHGKTVLVSEAAGSVAADGASQWSVMTPDARFIAFFSDASILVTGDTNGIADLFVRDLQTGQLLLATPGAKGVAGDIAAAGQDLPQLTPDGRFVVFHSTASSLVSGVKSADDIYVRDLVQGTTLQASVGARGAALDAMKTTNVITFNYLISDDGEFVAYEATPPAGTASLVLRFHRSSGITDVVSTNATAFAYGVGSLAMTPDGRFLAFSANAIDTTGETTSLLVWDGSTGTTTLASADLNDTVEKGGVCVWPALSADGRFLVFLSSASKLVTNQLDGEFHLYLRDLETKTTRLVNVGADGTGTRLTSFPAPSLSADGRLVGFEAPDSDLVANDRNKAYDVFIRDTLSNLTELVSAHDPALPSATPDADSTLSSYSVSGNSRWLSFTSLADDLVPGDTNGFTDVFVRDLVGDSNILISLATNGMLADGGSGEPSLNADGRFVVFSSYADNLVANDTNHFPDVFLRDLQAGTTELVSVSLDNVRPGNGDSYAPRISADARFILFRSKAKNLGIGTYSGFDNLFLRDRQLSKTYSLTQRGVTSGVMTPDGHSILILGGLISQAVSTGIYLWDSLVGTWVYTNSSSGVLTTAISSDGQRLLYWTSQGLFAVDRQTGTNQVITTLYPASRPGLRFSADNRFLTYAAASGPASPRGPGQIYLFDFQTGTNELLSRSLLGGGQGNGSSEDPAISGDGRYVAYRSLATDLVPNDSSVFAQVFLYDRRDGSTTLASANLAGDGVGNNFSFGPGFSGDGQYLFFESFASDLVELDFNFSGDIFAYHVGKTDQNTLQISSRIEGGFFRLSWPAFPGLSYTVEFKNELGSSNWQEASGILEILDGRATWRDSAAMTGSRFYRVTGALGAGK